MFQFCEGVKFSFDAEYLGDLFRCRNEGLNTYAKGKMTAIGVGETEGDDVIVFIGGKADKKSTHQGVFSAMMKV